jgi:hypothetical protein
MADRAMARKSDAAGRRTLLSIAAAGIAAGPSRWLAVSLGVLATGLSGAAPAAGKASKDLDLGEFSRLILQVPATVRFDFGQKHHAHIEAEQKVIDSIAFGIEGGTLRVSAAKSFNTRDAITIVITGRRLAALEAHAAVDVTVAPLSADRFTLKAADSANVTLKGLNLASIVADIEGSATVTADGSAKSQEVHLGGAGTYAAGGLVSQRAVVEAGGSSDAVIDSRESLEVDVSGAATVQYTGKPKLKQSVSGAGTLERK